MRQNLPSPLCIGGHPLDLVYTDWERFRLALVRGGDLAYKDFVPPYNDSTLSNLQGGAE